MCVIFMDQTVNVIKTATLLKLTQRLSATKLPECLLIKIDKWILKLIRKCKSPKINQIILRRRETLER